MKQERHVEEALVTRRRRFPRRWLLLLGLGLMVVWQLKKRQSAGLADAAKPAALAHVSAAVPAAAPGPGDTTEPSAVEPPTPPAVERPTPPGEEAALTAAEAAHILGCSPEEASQLLDGTPATRDVVERLALEHYRWRRHVDDPDSYWVTLKQASVILGVSTQRLKQLLDGGEVPFVVHRDGVRLMRREELAAAARVAQGKNVI